MLKDRTAATVIDSLTKELASKGALGVLRHGFKCYGKELRLAYFQPNSRHEPGKRRALCRQPADHHAPTRVCVAGAQTARTARRGNASSTWC